MVRDFVMPESGVYVISNRGTRVGRTLRERRHRRYVFSRTDDGDSLWLVQALPNGRSKLHTRGDPVGVQGNGPTGLLLAVHSAADAAEWELMPVAGVACTYRIAEPRGALWVTTHPRKRARISVLPVIQRGSSTFTFRRVERPR